MERQYLVSERPHLMWPNMHFGILCTIASSYDSEKMQEVLESLSNAHPFLKSLINIDQDGNYFYEYHEELMVGITQLSEKDNWKEDYEKLSKQGWNVFKEPLIKIYAYPELKSESMTILFVAHHLLCDGRGLLGLVEEFVDCYVSGKKPEYAKECLLRTINDLPAGSSLPWISKMIVNSVNKKWLKEQHKVNYADYLKFEKEYLKNNSYALILESRSKKNMMELAQLCKNNHISINDYLVAEMMCREHINKVVVAADCRKYLSALSKWDRTGSLGNYSTAFGVVCKSKKDNVLECAKQISVKVQEIMRSPKKLFLVLACYFQMNPDLIDAVAISSLGNYESKAGKFVGDLMFGFKDRKGYGITNLGKVDHPNIKEAIFIPPSFPANCVTQGVLTVNGIMKVCTLRV